MKTWQIFGLGVGVLVVALFLPSYEPILAGVAAIAMVVAVVTGFAFRPHKDVFYLRTTLVVSEPDHPLSVEHDCIAVRVELVRLWLLFLSTFAAVAFLIVTSAKATTWRYSLLDRFWEASYPLLLGIRVFEIIVVGLLSEWISERFVMWDAEACSADSFSVAGSWLLYSFRDRQGEYYGGEAFPFLLVRPRNLAAIVFYRAEKPQISKLGAGLLFYRLVVVGRGVTDLDRATVAEHSTNAQPASQPL
jgi:hypothetical protein